MEMPTNLAKDQLAATVIYLACRIEKLARTMQEISVSTGIDVKLINKLQKKIAQALDIDIGRVLPENLIFRIASSASIDSSIKEKARITCENIASCGVIGGQSPQVVAAAALVLTVVAINVFKSISNTAISTSIATENLISSPNIKQEFLPPFSINLRAISESSYSSTNAIGNMYMSLLEYANVILPLYLVDNNDLINNLPSFRVIETSMQVNNVNSITKASSNPSLVTIATSSSSSSLILKRTYKNSSVTCQSTGKLKVFNNKHFLDQDKSGNNPNKHKKINVNIRKSSNLNRNHDKDSNIVISGTPMSGGPENNSPLIDVTHNSLIQDVNSPILEDKITKK
jgi:hypothetical protein